MDEILFKTLGVIRAPHMYMLLNKEEARRAIKKKKHASMKPMHVYARVYMLRNVAQVC